MLHDPFVVPGSGAVLGIDVGFSEKRASTGLCVIRWDTAAIHFSFARAKVAEPARIDKLHEVVGELDLNGVAIDGPLTKGLRHVKHYRAAEALLSQGVLQKRGKPGSTSSKVGQQLHFHATAWAKLAVMHTKIATATHFQAIHEKCIVEAFPNIFLGTALYADNWPKLRRNASDMYWELLANNGRLEELFSMLLPGRKLGVELGGIKHHDDRAAAVCALSALCVVCRSFVGVGDPEVSSCRLARGGVPPRLILHHGWQLFFATASPPFEKGA